jgi:hypothetical protein
MHTHALLDAKAVAQRQRKCIKYACLHTRTHTRMDNSDRDTRSHLPWLQHSKREEIPGTRHSHEILLIYIYIYIYRPDVSYMMTNTQHTQATAPATRTRSSPTGEASSRSRCHQTSRSTTSLRLRSRLPLTIWIYARKASLQARSLQSTARSAPPASCATSLQMSSR